MPRIDTISNHLVRCDPGSTKPADDPTVTPPEYHLLDRADRLAPGIGTTSPPTDPPPDESGASKLLIKKIHQDES